MARASKVHMTRAVSVAVAVGGFVLPAPRLVHGVGHRPLPTGGLGIALAWHIDAPRMLAPRAAAPDGCLRRRCVGRSAHRWFADVDDR